MRKMTLSFLLNGRTITGEFTGMRFWEFETGDPFIKDHYPDGIVRAGYFYFSPITDAQHQILDKLSFFAEVTIGMFTNLNTQDFKETQEWVDALNLETANNNVNYVIAPMSGNTKAFFDFRMNYSQSVIQGVKPNLYSPEKGIEFSVYEVSEIHSKDGQVRVCDFSELVTKLKIPLLP